MKLNDQHKLLLMSVLQDTIRISDSENMKWILSNDERKKLYIDIIKLNEEVKNG